MKLNSLTYAGHSACLIGSDSVTVAIDPWLDGNPACPPALKDPKKLDVIVLTHGHADHAADAVALAVKHNSKVLATYELAMLLVEEGVPQGNVSAMNKGGSVTVQGLRITLTHAMHSSSYESKNGTRYAGEPCGVVVSDGTTTVYHAGDTALFSDMALIREFHHPDIALLPVGDCFTMGPAEAAQAATLIGCRLAIPVHFGTFPALTGDPQDFARRCGEKGVRALVMKPGETHRF